MLFSRQPTGAFPIRERACSICACGALFQEVWFARRIPPHHIKEVTIVDSWEKKLENCARADMILYLYAISAFVVPVVITLLSQKSFVELIRSNEVLLSYIKRFECGRANASYA